VTYAYDGNGWQVWNGKANSLSLTKYYDQLPPELEVPVKLGDLEILPGHFEVQVGYAFENNVLVFNDKEPINFTRANSWSLGANKLVKNDTTTLFVSWAYQGEKDGNPFTILSTESIGLATTIYVDAKHIGQQADMIMVATRQNK